MNMVESDDPRDRRRVGDHSATPRPPSRLAKEEALRRLPALRRGITAATLLLFGAVSGIVAQRVTGPAASPAQTPVAGTGQPDAQSQQQGGFFDQGQGGYGFGNDTSGQGPVAGTGTS